MAVETKYYVTLNGTYIGGFSGSEPEGIFIEVPYAPDHAAQVWLGEEWSTLTTSYKQITARQLRLALLNIGIQEADVDIHLVNDLAGMVEWKHASFYKRTHPLVDGLGAAFSITPEQIDSMWAWASEL